jgi:pimeloyl-ACP methyl ester carboxylesterase
LSTVDRVTDGPPSRALYYTEPVRAAAELAAFAASLPLLETAPRGPRQSVLVLPGLLASDTSTRPLRAWLRHRGYFVHGWRLGRNLGPTREIVDGLRALGRRLADNGEAPLTVIGWSLGGIFARDLAARSPELVRQVITLGSPFALAGRNQTNVGRAFRQRSHLHVPRPGGLLPPEVRGPLPVPSTSVWSREDGVVAWQACVERPSERAENVAVRGSHLGLGANPAVAWVIADRLAQPAGTWRPFRPPAALRALFPAVEPDRVRT